MPRRPSAALLAALALTAAPAGLAAPPPPSFANSTRPSPLAVSLRAAATASADELATALADTPARSRRALRDAAVATRAGLARLETWRARARTVAAAAAALHRLAAAGPITALDRALDAAAGAAVAVLALRLAWRARSHGPGRMRWAATD